MAKSKLEKWLEEDKLTLIEGWARSGLTNEQIAHNMGINPSTLYDYINKSDKISNVLKKGKEVVDYEVENALLKKALGYTTVIKKQKVTKDGYVVEVNEEVHFPGDTIAQIFWLKNRKPKEWREKQEIVSDNEQPTAINELVEALKNVKKD